MNRHDVRYLFEHKLLPGWFFKDGEQFIGAVINDKHILFRIISGVFKDEKVDNPYSDEDFRVTGSKIKEDLTMLKFTFPEPEEEPLCYCSYLFFDKEFQKISYFCIEKGNELSDDMPFVCSWTEDGTHLNHGNCTFEDNNDLLTCLDIHMKRFSQM